MTIEQKLEVVKEWEAFCAGHRQLRGTEPTVQEWGAALLQEAAQTALAEIRTIATEMLGDDFTREEGERILAEVEGVR